MRILVIKPSSLGDIIHGLQVVESIRLQLEDVQIDWVARDVFAPLVEACNTVDRVLPFYRSAGIGAFGQLLADIRDTHYDWVLDMQGLARSGLMTAFSKTPRKRRVGRSDAREGSRWAYGKFAKAPEGGSRHAVDILREFMPAMGLQNQLLGHLSFASPKQGALELPTDYLLLFPGSRRAEKEWPGFTDLTELLLEKTDAPIIWGGDVAADGRDVWPKDRFFNFTAKTALDVLPLLVGKAKLVICNDSGPMHLAAAMGKPVWGIFGPTPPELYGPYPLSAPQNHVVSAPNGVLADLKANQMLADILSHIQ
ncbi:glycosyltransferase family 9 protein [Cerasicoccus frondis]|uniref:glycosyltransferase family 9 protein n=1 Tax=Cerasicoccus frondis TaxID=490090 RepID=UPI002852BCB6|nr:glycosyltransferase family 9 protein [Cerasicoccus frondis]